MQARGSLHPMGVWLYAFWCVYGAGGVYGSPLSRRTVLDGSIVKSPVQSSRSIRQFLPMVTCSPLTTPAQTS